MGPHYKSNLYPYNFRLFGSGAWLLHTIIFGQIWQKNIHNVEYHYSVYLWASFLHLLGLFQFSLCPIFLWSGLRNMSSSFRDLYFGSGTGIGKSKTLDVHKILFFEWSPANLCVWLVLTSKQLMENAAIHHLHPWYLCLQ